MSLLRRALAARSEREMAVALLLAGLGLAAASLLRDIQPNDEGLMLQAAARIAHGEVPYRDFWWFYPPGQPYLLGGLWSAFGPSLVAWRIVRAVTNAVVAVLAYRLARGRSGRALSIAAWLASLLAMLYPTGPHPFPIALALSLGALLLAARRPGLAGALAGACAVWRIEFAAYLALGIVLAQLASPGDRASRMRPAMRFSGCAAGVAALAYAPLVAIAGLEPSWRLLVRYPLVQFSAYQSLPLAVGWPAHVDTSSVRAFLGHSAENLLLRYLPLALLAGGAAAVCVLIARGWARARAHVHSHAGVQARDASWVATAVFGAGMAHYLLIRPDAFHTAPLAVIVAVVSVWALTAAREQLGAGPRRRPWRRALGRTALLLGTAMSAAVLGYAIVEGVDRQRLVLGVHEVALDLPAAGGVRVPPAVGAPLQAAVRRVDALAPPGSPIYVTGLRNDLVTAGDPLFYVLADRANPTRYDIAAPGVITTAGVQREIVSVLERRRVHVVVRWQDPATAAPEPNRAGRSSGVLILDRYLAARYHPAARFGEYLVLTRVG